MSRYFARIIYLLQIIFSIANFSIAQDDVFFSIERRQYEFDRFPLKSKSLSYQPKVGLVLSGGGARAISQIGVLRSLENHNIPIDFIVGNSLGSVIGGLYAAGYSTTELESIVFSTNWDEVLSFIEPVERTELFVSQKQNEHIGYLLIRLDGLQPIIPSSISGGQRLSNYLMKLTLQAPYYPISGFQDLKIPFCAISTDILTGKRIVLSGGSLAEAMRASVTVPLLYTPLEKDSMALVDGGLSSNIPVDIARDMGCDVVIVVNSTSRMRSEDELKQPWEVADQIVTIMMQTSNELQLQKADVVITPDVGNRLVSDFTNLKGVIEAGERACDSIIPKIYEKIVKWKPEVMSLDTTSFQNCIVEFAGDSIPDFIKERIIKVHQGERITDSMLRKNAESIFALGIHKYVDVQVKNGASPIKVIYTAKFCPLIYDIKFNGNQLISDTEIRAIVQPLIGRSFNFIAVQSHLEEVLRLYRKRNYSLAQITNIVFDTTTQCLSFSLDEGIIKDIRYVGNSETKDYVIRRELPFTRGDVFDLSKITHGLINVASTGLFEYVLMDVENIEKEHYVVIRVKEKNSEMLLLGLNIDNERGIVGTINIRDVNFRGAGEDVGLFFRYGSRNRILQADYRANRIFRTYLTFHFKSYFNSRDVIRYKFESPTFRTRWNRVEDGRYWEVKYGWSFTFGTQLQRLGNVTAELRWERHRIRPIYGEQLYPEGYRLVSIKWQSIIDTEDKFSFPTRGMLLTSSLETAFKGLGSDVAFSKIGFNYEIYLTFLKVHTLRPKITIGYADRTLPIIEQYRWGGFTSFFGLREDDSRGRQIFLINFEYRYRLPFTIIFDTYYKARYDIGMISEVPEELKFNKFRHGIGMEIGLDTPIGPASFGVGQSFYFRRDLPNAPVTLGPLLIYFAIGTPL